MRFILHEIVRESLSLLSSPLAFLVTGKRFKYMGTYKTPKDPAVRVAPKKLYIKLVDSFGLGSAHLTFGKYFVSRLGTWKQRQQKL